MRALRSTARRSVQDDCRARWVSGCVGQRSAPPPPGVPVTVAAGGRGKRAGRRGIRPGRRILRGRHFGVNVPKIQEAVHVDQDSIREISGAGVGY